MDDIQTRSLSTASFDSGKGYKRSGVRRGVLVVGAVCAAILAVAVAIALGQMSSQEEARNVPAASTSGMELIEVPEGMSDEEIQAMLDEQARASTMDVAIASTMALSENELVVRFANDSSNKRAQRFVLEQDGEAVFVSDPVQPGYELERVELTRSQAAALNDGRATATITSVDADGNPVGNGAKIEVKIAGAGE